MDATLREQLLFPRAEATAGTDNPVATGESLGDDAAMLEALEAVGLRGVAERVGGLDAVVAWAQQLSPGEQQRLAGKRHAREESHALVCMAAAADECERRKRL